MLMMFPSYLVVVFGVVALSATQSAFAETVKCNTSIHYKEIGCTPILREGEKCPSSFNCDHLQKATTTDDKQCHFRGKTYTDHQGLESDILPPCVPYALCNEGGFMAGHIDCGPIFEQPGVECVYVRDGCCPKNVCGEEEIKKLTVCWAEGEKHHGGEKFSMKEDKCIQCKCDEKWSNATSIYENKNCKQDDCFQDFWNMDNYKKGCGPMYYGKDRCCPSQTKCPSADDKLIKATVKPTANVTGLKCKFGDLELEVGDGVNDNDNCMDCRCLTPPMIECHRIEGCERKFY